MDSVFLFARSLLLVASVLPLRAIGQADNVARCNVASPISQNLLGQDDCAIATSLKGICLGDLTPLRPLPFGFVYQGPELAYNTVNPCTCSTVFYTMVSACAWCQGGKIGMYSEWIGNCSTKMDLIGFPGTLPIGTSIPHWAYTDPDATGGTFNASTALLVGGTPETTAIPSRISGAKQSHMGAIVGGVAAGVLVVVVAVMGLVLWIWYKRRQEKVPIMNNPGCPPTPSTMQQPLTPPVTFENSAFYDPTRPTSSNPSYPGSPVQTTYPQSPPPGPVRHPGLPEIYDT
ncbi:hypothetical protein JAAARDRAFT_42452 [Jaapia argillacea MUCL 33604]|uniref:Uncharacterized protein n=1 Tax=Jaapia argillacea MUCL 33604 TaxID=933084 RepID=A0A067PHP1_9AGAM|nr:hypothetical protein JAAARDRAFT_42452 [Jaapia argillacea MUCL 33604]